MNRPFPFAPSGFFGIRTPALPFEFLEAWTADPGGSLAERRQALAARLRESVADPWIREALFLASPDLESMLEPWLEGRLGPDRCARIERALVRYLSRMASRCTPFGLFAGCSTGAWGGPSRIEVGERRQAWRHTRLDMGYLCSLAEGLELDPALRRALLYRPNPTLYPVGDQVRYAEGVDEPGPWREYRIVALEWTPHLEATLRRAAGGADLAALAAPLAGPDIPLEEAEGFVNSLIDNQVLMADLRPAVTGPDPDRSLGERLGREPAAAAAAPVLMGVVEACRRMDQEARAQEPVRYRSLARDLASLPGQVKLESLFQVDLFKPAPAARLGRSVQEAVQEAAALLWRLTPPRQADPLREFRTAFSDRHGERWLPLLEVLDQEHGIGFGGPAAEDAPLLDGLRFPDPGQDSGPSRTGRDKHMLARVQELGTAREWPLTDADLRVLEDPEPRDPPDAFSAVAMLAAASAQDLDRGHFQLLLEGFHGPSGANLLGRFCHGDACLAQQVREHLLAEEALRPDAVFAEIVHLPEGRSGNVICRPLLRRHELPILGRSGAPEELQIPLQDLQVGVRADRVVLRSRRLGSEVVPRLTSAFNQVRGLDGYRFLCALQGQGCADGGLSWGPLEALPFLPRVRRGRHILRKARWLLRQEEVKAILRLPPSQGFAAFGALREQRGIPRWVQLADGDHELLVDLDQPLWLETLLHLVAGRTEFRLLEFFPGPGDLVARSPEGRFCHQLVLPFIRVAPPAAQAGAAPNRARPPCEPAGPDLPRSFLPGSEWLTLKLYTGASLADRYLRLSLPPFLEEHADLFDRWFFIRYSDPQPHLRLRFHGSPGRLAEALLPCLHRHLAPLRAKGQLWKVQLDTYEREVERYGGPAGILLAESLFAHDSLAVLELVRAYPGDLGARWRWRLGLKAVDRFLEELGFDLEGRLGIVQEAAAGLQRESGAGGDLAAQLGHKFRPLRLELEALLFEADPGPEVRAGIEALAARSRNWRADLDRLCRAETDGTLLRPRRLLAMSHTHMHLNRLLCSAQRRQEFVIYDFLGRLYRSRLARPGGLPRAGA